MSTFAVTGASTGIGRATVAELARAGHRVFAAVRTDKDADSLRAEHGEAVRPLLLDLTDEATVRAAGEQVCAEGPVHGLVNNAGVALPGPLEYLPIDVFRRQIEINLTGQLLVTQVMLPALRQARAAGDGARIVMVGSIGGRIASPMLGAYSAAKFGLVGLTDALRAELAPSGITVVLIEPGAVATPIWQRGMSAGDELANALPSEGAHYADQIAAARLRAEQTAARGIPPQRAAVAVVRALTARNPHPRQLLGRDAMVAGAFARVLPYRVIYRLTAARGGR
jgi:NAD(P)-dependent dehydrogenase (short-subunit alcohol dehydrogenase family)